MSKGMSLAAGGVVLVAVIAGGLLLANDDSEVVGGGATVSTSRGADDAPPSFENGAASAAIDAARPQSSAPLAVADTPAAVAPSQPKAAAPRVGPSVTVTGRVVDENGRPVPDARVTFVSDPLRNLVFTGGRSGGTLPAEASPHVQTGRDGRFSVTGTLPPPEDKRDGLPLPEIAPQLVVQQDVFATLVHAFETLAAPGADVGDLQLAAGCWLTGRVVDEAGRPLAGAHVRAHGHSDGRRNRGMFPFLGGSAEALDEITTGTDGRFRVNGVPAGKADLTVSAEGRRLAEMQDLELEARQPKDVGDVALARGQAIAGVVLDAEGKGLAGAAVSVSSMARLVVNRIEDLPRGQIGQEFGQRAVTGADGSFEISGLGGGQYTVHVSADGFDRLSKEDIPAGTRDLRLVPIRLGGLFVRLESQGDGKPVAEARLRATAVDESRSFMRPEETALTVLSGQAALDAAGRTGDPAGAWFVPHAGLRGTKLVVAADGFATKEIDGPPVESRAIGEVSVLLVPESVVAGKVLRPDGAPVHGANVTLAAPRPDDDERGGFRGPPGGRRFSRSITIGDADEAETLDAGRLTTQTMADGSFELRGAAPGAWELSAKHEDHVDSTPQGLTLAAGESQRELVITLAPAGVIVGTVVEADGTPAADVQVTASSAVARAPSGDLEGDITATVGRMLNIEDGTGRRFARTASDGSYRISGLAEGEYDVTLGRGNRRGRTMGGGGMFFAFGGPGESSSQPPQVVKVAAGAEVRADFVRARRGTITGRVIAGGRPVPDQPVTMRRKSEGLGGFRLPFGGEEARTDDRGEYSFADVEAGEYDLSTHVPRSALEREVSVKLEAGDARTADIVFGGSTLSGTVVDKDQDAGAGGVNVTLVPVKDEPAEAGGVQMSFAFVTADNGPGGGGGGMTMEIGNGPAQQIRTDPEGRFELLWVEPGRYRLEASGGGYVKGEAEAFDVSDGQNKNNLVVLVARGATVQGTVVSGQTGEHLDSVPVRIEGEDSRQTTVTQNGNFKFEGLASGTYTVTVLGSGFGGDFGGSSLASEKVKVDGGETKTLDLKTKS